MGNEGGRICYPIRVKILFAAGPTCGFAAQVTASTRISRQRPSSDAKGMEQ